ncbi:MULTISPECIES: hypothetical protein [unclassified Streptomyces]|uniref:hypothetical protein n=1 Tax=unclassified Streptomyces TaxID=2593676 RepID=UPI00278BEF6F|nr:MULTISPECIES: hypothetical protein [unclassified Streptomyces]
MTTEQVLRSRLTTARLGQGAVLLDRAGPRHVQPAPQQPYRCRGVRRRGQLGAAGTGS